MSVAAMVGSLAQRRTGMGQRPSLKDNEMSVTFSGIIEAMFNL